MTRDDDLDRASAADSAELAVLDAALAERFCGATPPDLWPALAMRLGEPGQPGHPTAGPQRARRWLAVALLLLGLGVVTGLAVWTPRPGVRPEVRQAATSGLRLEVAVAGPRNLAELQQRLRAANAANVQAHGTWSDELQRWVGWPRNELDSLFRSGLRPELDPAELTTMLAALQTASVGPLLDHVVWTHELTITGKDTASWLLLRVGGGAPNVLAFRSPLGAVALLAPSFPWSELQPRLASDTEATIAGLGIVIGGGGFDAVPTTSSSLRLIDVPADRVHELNRYPAVARLDLAAAPGWHDPTVLRQLTGRTLTSLVLAPALLPASAYPALGSMVHLQELFLVGGDMFAIVCGAPVAPAPGLDDAALAALLGLQRLRELTLAGGSFGDEALRPLGALPALRQLALFDCRAVRGSAFDAFAKVKYLALVGGALRPEFVENLAAMPELGELAILEPGCQVPLSALPRAGKLGRLTLSAACDRGQLVYLERCAALRMLRLRLSPSLRDDELVLLQGLRQVRTLGLASEQVTEAGRASLRATLPGCSVSDELW